MTTPRTPVERLTDILTEAEYAIAFLGSHTRDTLAGDPRTLRAVLHCLTIIGESATHLSQPTRDRAADIPWRQVVGMRNRLIHDYIRTDLGVVWDTVTANLPALIQGVRRPRDTLLAEQPPTPETE